MLKLPARKMIKQGDNHFYIIPNERLKPYIAHYTLSFPSTEVVPDTLTLIPDASGCIVCTIRENSFECEFWGATTKVVVVKNDVNQIPMRLFIEFLPGGAYQVLGMPQSEFTDVQVPLDVINQVLAQHIRHAYESADNSYILIDKIEALLLACLGGANRIDLITMIIPYVQGLEGKVSVKELSEMTCYSQRHLSRVFNSVLGINVKTYTSVLRINKALEVMKQPDTKLISVAQDAGYYDQAHFIHDFKAVCGVKPSDYLQNMSDFYNETYKF